MVLNLGLYWWCGKFKCLGIIIVEFGKLIVFGFGCKDFMKKFEIEIEMMVNILVDEGCQFFGEDGLVVIQDCFLFGLLVE